MSDITPAWRKRVSGTAHLLKGKSVQMIYDREFDRLAKELGQLVFDQAEGAQDLDDERKRLIGRMRDNRARRDRDLNA